ATWDPGSRGGTSPDGRTVKGTIHWVSAEHAVDAEVRLYDRLFDVEDPLADEAGFLTHLNPDSLAVVRAKAEPYLADAAPGSRWQLERVGYFCADSKDCGPGRPVLNRTVPLKDSWARLHARLGAGAPAKPVAPQPPPAPEPSPAGEAVARTDLKPLAEEITIDAIAKVDLRAGLVRSASAVEGAKKLIRLGIDLGEGRLRQVFAGIRAAYPDPSVLVGRRLVVVANLKPREMKWGVSEGMVLAGGNDADGWRVAFLDGDVEPGDPVS
ncbi:MAG: hypothetical protein FJ087_12760, partial [Deltaproteobacteria bacterium]|nr:hypothetical protein [Deltaproteobacteria bacterium]